MAEPQHPTRAGATEEAERILRLASEPEVRELHDLITRQYDVLHHRGGVLVTFCGVVITTTGFSGRIIAGTNRWAQALVIAGVAVVLAAAWVVLVRVMRICWVTRETLDGDAAAVAAVLGERDLPGDVRHDAVCTRHHDHALAAGAGCGGVESVGVMRVPSRRGAGVPSPRRRLRARSARPVGGA